MCSWKLDCVYDVLMSAETASQKSSRVPSPIATQNYDDMEGQFVAYTPAGKSIPCTFLCIPVSLVYFSRHILLW